MPTGRLGWEGEVAAYVQHARPCLSMSRGCVVCGAGVHAGLLAVHGFFTVCPCQPVATMSVQNQQLGLGNLSCGVVCSIVTVCVSVERV